MIFDIQAVFHVPAHDRLSLAQHQTGERSIMTFNLRCHSRPNALQTVARLVAEGHCEGEEDQTVVYPPGQLLRLTVTPPLY